MHARFLHVKSSLLIGSSGRDDNAGRRASSIKLAGGGVADRAFGDTGGATRMGNGALGDDLGAHWDAAGDVHFVFERRVVTAFGHLCHDGAGHRAVEESAVPTAVHGAEGGEGSELRRTAKRDAAIGDGVNVVAKRGADGWIGDPPVADRFHKFEAGHREHLVLGGQAIEVGGVGGGGHWARGLWLVGIPGRRAWGGVGCKGVLRVCTRDQGGVPFGSLTKSTAYRFIISMFIEIIPRGLVQARAIWADGRLHPP